MRVQSARGIAFLWAATLTFFLLSAWVSSALGPAAPALHPTASYYVGLVGLLAIGLTLVLTWKWVGRAGPTTVGGRIAIRAALVLLGILWVLAMVFPFL
jgi:hypothetical protein